VSLGPTSDVDARRVGWWQRRRAASQIRRATAITGADRDLRLQSVTAAQTRGELNALVWGLDDVRDRSAAAPGPALSVGPRATWMPPPALPRPPVGATVGSSPGSPLPRSRSVGKTVATAAVVGVFLCGGSLVSCVSSIVDSVSDSSSEGARAAAEPLTAAGWTAMVRQLDAEAGIDRSVELVVQRRSATLSVAQGGSEPLQRYYYDGDVTQAQPVGNLMDRREFDLEHIEPDVVADAVARARREAGVPAYSRPSVTVRDLGQGPQIEIRFPDDAAVTYELVVGVDGIEVFATP
jgi:hypothetical protein